MSFGSNKSKAYFLNIVIVLLYTIDSLGLSLPPSLLSRYDFLSLLPTAIPSVTTIMSIQEAAKDSSDYTFPLKFLPRGGCWALKITLSDEETDQSYYAILDTGSPFLTAPTSVVDITKNTSFPITREQYGESKGEVQWRKASYLTLVGNSRVKESRNVVVGVESSVEETGGIFIGLIDVDDNRPSFLQQIGRYPSFMISFVNNYLQLTRTSLIAERDPNSLPLIDLRKYGPDLHHYAVVCPRLELQWKNGETQVISTSELNRPVFAVLDTGLTGCIFSDSLFMELCQRRGTKPDTDLLKGATVSLETQRKGTINLPSSDQYWFFTSFQLPWFFDEDTHPHIVALGCTFWAGVENLTIDTHTRRAKLQLGS